MNYIVLLVTVMPSLIQCYTIYYRPINERCQLDNGLNGTCKNIFLCPAAGTLLRDRKNIKICKNGRKNVVCCPQIEEKNVQDMGTTISQEKCEEYSNLVPFANTPRATPSPIKNPQYDALVNITSGVPASRFEYPHMALLGYGKRRDIKWLCGGSVISEKFIITAAHCIYTKRNTVRYVAVGAYSLHHMDSDNNIQRFEVEKAYVHQEYNVRDHYNDIGLIQVNGNILFHFGVRPACLHSSRDIPEMFMISGWGSLESGGGNADILQKAAVVRVSNKNCRRIYGRRPRLPHGVKENLQICARGNGSQLADTCQGDSGGPLQIKMPSLNIYTIVGITSFGLSCGITASVYTRISSYVPWVETIVWPRS